MSHTKSKFSPFPQKDKFEIIRGYQPTLETALSTHGWSIKKRKKFTDNSWFLEMWNLQSKWSPADLEVFLMFEDDEMFYAAAIYLEEPINHRLSNYKAHLYLKRGWEQELLKFIATLNSIRDDAVSLGESNNI